MDQYIGKMLDNRYEILECIGTGGMAVVYKARDHRLNRLVAVKILKPELASDADFRRRFHDESQAVAMLSHANIVSVYDVSRSDGMDYIVMELIDGMTLKQYMQRRGTPLNWREAVHFITQIMRALSHAHSRGIIHRDIKPHNIMVLRDGSVKVTDFGIAQLASAAQNTMTQEAIGSVHYISPEQAKGSHVDCRTDIYSAGVVLYEMLTGRLPFEGDTPVAVAIQHIKSIPVPPRDLNPEVPRALESITMKAMAPELGQRYASADEMLDDLKEFRKNPDFQPFAANAGEPDEPTQVVPAKVITTSVRVPVERREPERAQPERQRRREVEEDDYYDDEPPRRGGGVAAAVAAVVLILAFIGCIVYFLWNFFAKDLLFPETQEYEVPSLLGYTVEQLEQNKAILDGFDFEVGPTVFSADYPEGQICAQSPDAKTKVKEGAMTITVSVSGGEDKMYMPGVESWDYRQALQTLQDEMGLKVKQEEDFSDTITQGYVISQSLKKDTWVEPGDEVTIVISKGPEVKQATVTNFLNVPLEQAQEQITQLGLKVGKVSEYHSDEYAEGRVMWQSANPGDQLDKDTAVDLWVSLGPEPVAESDPPAVEPTGGDLPVESDQLPEPTLDVAGAANTKSIYVDLGSYEGTVNVRIVVGDRTIHDSPVDADMNSSFSKNATASGVQMVSIYINGLLVSSYPLDFNS
ncbi:MAG: Stk1 family PASTA domain-containing Ser/Thr kinase [Clostridiales bacterium]|nr:Stk1 family PASTA domain-containing Ser/Thr kinase [Clostridiales bacterium]